MALLIFLTIAMAHGASEEFLKGKLEQLSQDLRKNAQSLDEEIHSIKREAASERLYVLIDKLGKTLHQYRHVSQEFQIAKNTQKHQNESKMKKHKELEDLQSELRSLQAQSRRHKMRTKWHTRNLRISRMSCGCGACRPKTRRRKMRTK